MGDAGPLVHHAPCELVGDADEDVGPLTERLELLERARHARQEGG
jgi:hypothetical protein